MGKFAINSDGDGVGADLRVFFRWFEIKDFEVKVMMISESGIHSKKHRDPVSSFETTGTGIDG